MLAEALSYETAQSDIDALDRSQQRSRARVQQLSVWVSFVVPGVTLSRSPDRNMLLSTTKHFPATI
jgi:hypothetical protein